MVECCVARRHALLKCEFLCAAILVLVAPFRAIAAIADPPRVTAIVTVCHVQPAFVQGVVKVGQSSVHRITQDRNEIQFIPNTIPEGVSISRFDSPRYILVRHLRIEVCTDYLVRTQPRFIQIITTREIKDVVVKSAVDISCISIVPVMMFFIHSRSETVDVIDSIFPQRRRPTFLTANHEKSWCYATVVAERRSLTKIFLACKA
mmetsp:Transcript_20115/g.27332  ORF Transcript_20115/g.27332 Transcript_20115/m.27332 type:complete len:205 (-) Transcript_20115:186-800(-)